MKKKVAAVVVVYKGCFDSIQVFSEADKGRRRYRRELLEEYYLTEETMAESDYDIALELDLIVY